MRDMAATYSPSIHNGSLDAVYRRWGAAYEATGVDDLFGPLQLAVGVFPPEDLVRRYVRRLPLFELFRAVKVTRARHLHATEEAARYFLGVCRRLYQQRRAEEEEAERRQVWAEGFAAGVQAERAKEATTDAVAVDVPTT